MQPGDVISERFELGAHLGTGAMGVVFRALDHATGADVAVKVLRDPDLRYQARLEREAQVLAGLHHPNIVRYIAHGTTSLDEAYLVMEWIDGEDLSACSGAVGCRWTRAWRWGRASPRRSRRPTRTA